MVAVRYPREEAHMPAENAITVYVDGDTVTIDKMTFRERREVRRLAVELSETPESEDYTVDDVVMGMIAVAKRRKEPEFDPEKLLDEAPDPYLVAPPTSEGPKPRRTARAPAAKPKTS